MKVGSLLLRVIVMLLLLQFAGDAQAKFAAPETSGPVYVILPTPNAIYIGGGFSTVGGKPQTCLAALDPVTGEVLDWNPGPTGGSVRALAIMGSTLYVGGHFTKVNGQTRNGLAAVDCATGAVTEWNPQNSVQSSTDYIYALGVSGGTVYVGGVFDTLGGQTRKSLAALDAATGALKPWNPNNGQTYAPTINALKVMGSTIYVGGLFLSTGGQSRSCLAALDAVTGNATAWNPNVNGEVGAMVIENQTVYFGGAFSVVNGQARGCVAAVDAITGAVTEWNPYVRKQFVAPGVMALAIEGSNVFIGGQFDSINGSKSNLGQPLGRIAVVDRVKGKVRAWDPKVSDNGVVLSVGVTGGKVYFGGNFAWVNGVRSTCFGEFPAPPPYLAVGSWGEFR